MLHQSYNMFGFKVTPLTAIDQLQLIERHIEARDQCVLAHLNLHGLHVLTLDHEMSRLHAEPKTYVALDGMPLVLLCRLAGISVTRQHRVTNLDLIWPLLSLSEQRGWRVYYVGSTDEVAKSAVHAVRARLPKLHFQAHHGFLPADSSEVIQLIARFRADLVMVGMGMGLQESWISRNKDLIAPAVLIPVGALMEYVTGVVRTPPRWMGRAGLEWLFRLADDPRRFWRRYLLEPWLVAAMLIRKRRQDVTS